GRAALQERTGRAQGVGGLLPRLQPRARGDAGGGAAAGGSGGARELRRCAEVDAARPTGRRAAGADRQPQAARPRRAALQEAATQEVRPDEQAARRAPKTPEKTAEERLTKCH